MELQTRIRIPLRTPPFGYKNKMLLLGSCFADQIGRQLKQYHFNVRINPFGTLYNPVSVLSSLQRLADKRFFTREDIVETNGTYATFYHHGSLADTSPERFLENANRQLETDSVFFREADTIAVTLGTARIYRHRERNIIVSNCRKKPEADFIRELLVPEQIADSLQSFVSRFPDKRYIFTISPIRHLKDGAHGNRISKAILLLALELLQERIPEIYYFPAYEIMLDELRDYRFYTEDMIHPSAQAVRYIFERFRDACIAPEEHPLMQEVLQLEKSLQHLPMFPDTPEWSRFCEKRDRELQAFRERYPYISI